MYSDIGAALALRADQAIPIVALLDANAKMGSVVSPGVGAFAQESQCDNGLLLAEFVEKLNSMLPSTFHEFVSGDTATLKAGEKHQRRIDHVAVSQCNEGVAKTTHVEIGFDMFTSCVDHAAVVVTVKYFNAGTAKPPKRRKMLYNRKRMSDESRCQAFAADIACLPEILFGVDTDTHFGILKHQWVECCRCIFRCPIPCRRGRGSRVRLGS